MYVFINDLSINPPGVNIQNNWPLLDSVMDISFKLKDEYLLEKVRVPKNFMETPIANSKSINQFMVSDDIDYELKNLLYDFLTNRVDEIDEEIKQELDKAQGNKVFYSYYNGLSSDMLTEAHVMKAPVLSFATSALFQTDHLQAELRILSEEGDETTKNIALNNIFNSQSITFHAPFLVNWKHKITFRITRWNPIANPIWNELTSDTLDNIDFPQSISKNIDKKAELRRVGTIVAEMNGWILDKEITDKNKNSGQLRCIFRSQNPDRKAYLSIDFEKTYGVFELHKHNGKHLGEIDFKGIHPPKNADPNHNNDHDIKVN